MGLPPHPRHLGGRARDAWIFWSAELAIMNLDRRPDAMMLEGACVGYAQAVQADILIENDGPVVDEPIMDTMGEVVGHKLKRHPAVTVSRTAWAQVRAFATEFGLSPVSRTRLAVERQDATPMELSTLLATPREPRKIVN